MDDLESLLNIQTSDDEDDGLCRIDYIVRYRSHKLKNEPRAAYEVTWKELAKSVKTWMRYDLIVQRGAVDAVDAFWQGEGLQNPHRLPRRAIPLETKRAVGRWSRWMLDMPEKQDLDDVDPDDDSYSIEEIVQYHSHIFNDSPHGGYLAKWKGYDSSMNSWVRFQDIVDYMACSALDSFWRSMGLGNPHNDALPTISSPRRRPRRLDSTVDLRRRQGDEHDGVLHEEPD